MSQRSLHPAGKSPRPVPAPSGGSRASHAPARTPPNNTLTQLQAAASAAPSVGRLGALTQMADAMPRPVLQARFWGSDGAVVPPATVLARLTGDAQTQLADRLGLDTPDALGRALEKLAEGPGIRIEAVTGEDLARLIGDHFDSRRSDPAQNLLGADAGSKDWRRLNRIVGLIEQKSGLLHGNWAGLLDAHSINAWQLVMSQANLLAGPGAMARAIDPLGGPALLTTLGLLTGNLARYVETFGKMAVSPDGQPFARAFAANSWLIHNFASQLGPLAYWLSQNGGGDDGFHTVRDNLRAIRQSLANRAMPSVVVHRGFGPTNRTMGGLIDPTEKRRVNRPTENSRGAMEGAMDYAAPSPRDGSAALDGVECDVFLSSDGVPILSHEGKVLEQINAGVARQPGIGAHTEIKHVTADTIRGQMRRKLPGTDITDPASGFLTLAELLELVVGPAGAHFGQTGQPLRVEIEMKGAGKEPHGADLGVSVGHVVSRFHKTHPGAPVEILIFGGAFTDVARYSDMRSHKAALGGVYTGINAAKVADGQDWRPQVDELRSSFPDSLTDPTLLANLMHYIVTLVHDQEFLPSELVEKDGTLADIEPETDVENPMATRRWQEKNQKRARKRQGPAPVPNKSQLDPATGGLRRIEVRDALAARGRAEPTADDRLLTTLTEMFADPSIRRRLHILTDYPQKAAFLKSKINEARKSK